MKLHNPAVQGKTLAAIALMLCISISLADEASRNKDPATLVVALASAQPTATKAETPDTADKAVLDAVAAISADNKLELDLRLKSPKSLTLAEQ